MHLQPQNPTLRRSLRIHSRRIPEWSSLPDIALFNVATRLDIIQFVALAAVCKSWRTICTQNKPQIIGHHPPLLLGLDLAPLHRTLPVCHLYNFPDHRLYTKPLPPRFQIRGFDRSVPYQMGCFYGYIVLYYCSKYSVTPYGTMYLANPFTEELIELPPVATRCMVLSTLLTAPPTSADSVVVALTEKNMMVCRPGVDDSWSDVRLTASVPPQIIFPTLMISVKQAVIFKGLVYIVKENAVITVEVKFGQNKKEEARGIQFAPFFIVVMDKRCRLMLFVGEEDLFAVEVVLKIFPDAGTIKRKYRLREGGSWEEVESLGGLGLFTDYSSEFVPGSCWVTGWHQWDSADRVFYVDSRLYYAKNEGELPSNARNLECKSHTVSLTSFSWASANNEGCLPSYAHHLECGFNCVPSLRSYYQVPSNNEDDLPSLARRLKCEFNHLPAPTNLYWVSPRELV